MKFPINAFADFGVDGSLLLSLLIGIGFGFMLERGGFGSSKVLAGIFYGRDWRVLKVMFTAVVTAMVGLYALDGLGLVAMQQVAFKSTYLVPQIVGGLLLGVGFVTAGYCPGTSVVGVVSGRLDALFALGGMILGIGLFEEFYGSLEGLYLSGYMGEISVAQYFGISPGLVALAVALMALGAFSAVGWFERKREGRPLPRNAIPSVALLAGAGVLAAAIQMAGPGSARPLMASGPVGFIPEVQAVELAACKVEGRTDHMLLDVRGAGAQPTLPGAVVLSPEDLVDLRRRPLLPADRVLLVVDQRDEGTAREVAAALRRDGLEADVLQGGAASWQSQVLDESAADPRAQAYRLMISGESPFGGAPPPPPAKASAPPPRAQKKGGGCS